MFSALKSKLTSSPSTPAIAEKSQTEANSHHGINSMNAALQRKFAKGVHYNLKLLLRGDRNTGKSCLFKRLQVSMYVPKKAFAIQLMCSRVNSITVKW